MLCEANYKMIADSKSISWPPILFLRVDRFQTLDGNSPAPSSSSSLDPFQLSGTTPFPNVSFEVSFISRFFSSNKQTIFLFVLASSEPIFKTQVLFFAAKTEPLRE